MTTFRPEATFDADPGVEIPKRVPPTLELGQSGLRRVSGYVDEEFLPQLRGRKAVQVFREMVDNDEIAGALVFAIERLLRQLEWRVEPASSKPEHRQDADFIEENMQDMSHSWGDFIAEVCSMVPYGWALSEIVYKRRVGPWEKDAAHRSRFTDGRIGWRKIALRSQETLQRWVFDETGGIQAMVQIAPPDYRQVVLPIDKCLLFRTTTAKNNPEGYSMLRRAYKSYYYKKRIQEYEAIGIERDLAGMPVGRVPASYFTAAAGTKEKAMLDAFTRLVKSVRRDEQEGIVLPQEFDEDTKQPLFNFELLNSGGSRQFDTESIIQRYNQGILMQCLADFILVGHQDNGGSYALHTDKTGMFRTSINSLAMSIADVLNRHAIPRLFAINGMKPDELPRIVPSDVDPPALDQLGSFMTSMAAVGMQWFPDPTLEQFIRDAARLPKLDEQKEKILETSQRQAQMLALAQQQLQLLQTEQQAQQGEIQMRNAQLSTQQQALSVAASAQSLQNPPKALPAGKAATRQASRPTAKKPLGKSSGFGITH